jgi:hypothetical protein
MDGSRQADPELEQIKDYIRQEAARKRAEVVAAVPLSLKARDGLCFNWLEVKDRLRLTRTFATADKPPALDRFHGLRRRIAQWTAKIVMKLTRFITNRQMEYNIATLDLVQDMAEALHDVEKRLVQQQEMIHQLEATITRLQLRQAA